MHACMHADGQTDRQAGRQADSQTDKTDTRITESFNLRVIFHSELYLRLAEAGCREVFNRLVRLIIHGKVHI